MTLIQSLLFAATPVLGVLVEVTIKGTLVLGAAAVLILALRRASAALRHAIWVCAFCAALALPALLTLPAWRIGAPALAWLQPLSRPEPVTLVNESSAFRQARDEARVEAEEPSPVAEPRVTQTAPDASTPAPPIDSPRPTSWAALAVGLWVLGALTVLFAFLVGYRELRRLIREAAPVRDGEWNTLAMEAADRLRLHEPFILLRSEGLPVPVAVGLVRPRVLLPSGSDSWPLELRRAVLLHELAHVQRRDCLTQAIAQVVCAVFWFHPAFWWAASQMRTERERACDDCVLRAKTKATDYAEHLLGVVRSLRGSRLEAMGSVAFARPSSLEGRLLSVLDPIRDRRAVGVRVAGIAAVAAAILVVPLAILEPGAQAYSVRFQSKSHHQESNPNSLRPSRLVAVPKPEGSLEERVSWARADADRSGSGVYWLGWRMDPSPNLKGNVLNDSEGISLWLLDQHGLYTLGDVLDGQKQGTWNKDGSSSDIEDQQKSLALLVRVDKGKTDRFRVQSLSLPADFSGQPLYWMDRSSDEETTAWLRDFAGRSHDEGMRRQAIESLGFMKRADLVVPILRSTLDGKESDEVRAGAAEGLGHQPSTDVVRLLASHARKDRSPEVRRASVEALGQQQTREALEELLAIARGSEGDAVARRAAFDALGEKVSNRAVAESMHAQNGSWDGAEEKEKGERLKEKTETLNEELNQQLNEKLNKQLNEDEASAPMNDSDLEVQRQAIESLGRYPEAQSLPRLRHIAETSPNGELRAQAVESIGRLGTPAALEVIEQVVWKNRMEEARQSAVNALGRQLPDEQALEKLAPIARSHPSPETRRMAIELAGRADTPKALALLREIVAKGKDPDVQRQAVESMGRRDEPGVEAQLLEIARTHPSIDVRRQAVESLGRRDGKEISAELLEIARQDGPEDVQRQAVESLGRLDADVTSALEKIARSHPSSAVRRQAVESLMQRDPDQALRVIEEILREPKKAGS